MLVWSGLILGFLGSFHCIGMCGPLAVMLPISNNQLNKKHGQILLYHLGRIVAYSILGLLFGIAGKGFQFAGIQQQLSILIGVIMILLVVFPKVSNRLTIRLLVINILLTRLKKQMGLYLKKDSYYALFCFGFFNGFLPCGMVYIALVGAIAMPSLLESSLYMLLYGLGTVPLLSVLLYIKNSFSIKFKKQLQRIIPFFVVAIGILFILRGLGLGIPYVSPSDNTLFINISAKYCHE
ncbi:sulfite exporter TauE/SafE family protein [Pseudofulvibacter geojedonensis]|uniref:Sulfite exporter TauE/SafE family protein n=1 Tax=Pseudofulvibacter geojedonensis TaxID=1123758 RepID=A0ABW3I2H8_9FLAO